MAQRIDSLKKGDTVLLRFHGSKRLGNEAYELETKFERMEGEGDNRRAIFDEVGLYRFDGKWAYGTSAEKASLIKVLDK